MAFCVLMFAVACYWLAFGVAIFCCAPVSPRGGFWRPERLFYGLLPMCASIAIFLFVFRLWARAYVRRRNAWLVGWAVAISAVFLDFTLFLKYRGRGDEQIKLVWKGESNTFSWGRGEIKLPAGFSYKADHGIDTVVGYFTSQDGRLVIQHDIGEYAGEHGGMGKSETLTAGSRVRVGRAVISDGKGGSTIFSIVSFPDSGCANFYLESPIEKDTAVIEFIARSFRPIGWTPAWMGPLLPEVLRSDCRYRFQLPNGFWAATIKPRKSCTLSISVML